MLIYLSAVCNQIQSDLVVAKGRSHMERSHAVHEGFHEALLLDTLVIFVSGICLLFFLDQLAIVQVDRRAHFNQGLDRREISTLDCGKEWSLPIIVENVDFGTKTSVLASLRLR